MPENDEELVGRILGGDGEAFGVLMKKYRRRTFALAYSQLRNAADAEDLAQEAFVQAFRSLKKLKEPAKFASWMARITINVCRDFLRERARKQIKLEDLQKEGSIDCPLEEAIKNETGLEEIITSALSELPEDVQGCVMLRFFESLSYKEIGEYLDLPVSTVRGALYRGTKYLRKRLKPYMFV